MPNADGTLTAEEQRQADEQEIFRRTGIDPREIALLRATYDNPETKLEQQRLFAKVKPETKKAMPELALREEFDKEVADLRKERDEYKAEREKAKQEQTRLEAIREAMNDPAVGLRREEIEDVEKLMVARAIGNYKDGARLFRAERSVAAPRLDSTIWMPGQQEQDDEFYKKLWKTPATEMGAAERDKLVSQEAGKMLHEFKTGEGQRKYAPLMTV